MDEIQPITNLNLHTSNFRRFSEEVQSLIEAMASEYGLSVRIAPYQSKKANIVNTTIEFAVTQDRHGNAVNPDLDAFEAGYWSHKIESQYFGKVFRDVGSRHGRYRIVGYAPRSRKYSVIVEARNGQRYKYHPQAVRNAIENRGVEDHF